MSEQETIKGEMKLMFTGTEEELEIFCDYLCNKNGYHKADYHNSYRQCVEDDGYKDYVFYKNSLYEITETRDVEDEDIYEASLNEDGTVSFFLSYYNGGCSFGEAIEEALENMETE